ncbi:MAG: DUF4235 domain-containing protein [Solirubrobacteraceae bacterium]
MVKLLYWPLSLVAGFISARLGKTLFRKLWEKIDDEPPPKAGSGEGSAAKVIGAQALQAGIMAASAATVHRAFAKSFHYLVGAWPEKPAAEQD